MRVKCNRYRLERDEYKDSTCMAVELPMNVAAIGRPSGATSQTATFNKIVLL